MRKRVIGHARKEVAAKLEALLRAKREERPMPDGRTKLGPFLRRWLDEVAGPARADGRSSVSSDRGPGRFDDSRRI